jgi:hypothetical protein
MAVEDTERLVGNSSPMSIIDHRADYRFQQMEQMKRDNNKKSLVQK